MLHCALKIVALADANYRFIVIDIGDEGKRRDGGSSKYIPVCVRTCVRACVRACAINPL